MLEAVTEDKIGKMYFSAFVEEGNVFCKAIERAISICKEHL